LFPELEVMKLETDRLILREFTAHDDKFLLALMNTPGWLQFIGDRGIRSEDDARNYIVARITSSYTNFGFGFYVMELKEGETPIGMSGLIKRDTLEDVDVGFALLPEYEGKGYAYEATAAVVKYAWAVIKLRRLVAIVVESNKPSIRLLEKLGMTFEKKIRPTTEELMLFAMDNGSTL